MKKILKDYLDLQDEINALETKKAKIKSKIVDSYQKDGIEKEVYDGVGTFTLSQGRKTYQYSKELKAKIAKMQKKEVADGVAEVKIGDPYLIFTPVKK